MQIEPLDSTWIDIMPQHVRESIMRHSATLHNIDDLMALFKNIKPVLEILEEIDEKRVLLVSESELRILLSLKTFMIFPNKPDHFEIQMTSLLRYLPSSNKFRNKFLDRFKELNTEIEKLENIILEIVSLTPLKIKIIANAPGRGEFHVN